MFRQKGKTFRHKAFDGYKAKRKRAPDELYEQIPLVKKILRAFSVPIFSLKGVEADDIVGAIAGKVGKKKEMQSIIVTGDLDTLQLVDEKTRVFGLRRGTKDTVLYDKKEVIKKTGVLPEQVVDFKALAGDSSDNIPGVAGVGQKTAAGLLEKYENLDGVYENLAEISGALKKKLEKSKDDAYLSQRLARIQVKMNLDFDLEQARFGDYNQAEVKSVLEELEFWSLIKRLEKSGVLVADKAGDGSKIKTGAAGKDSGRLDFQVIEAKGKEDFDKWLSEASGRGAVDGKGIFMALFPRPLEKIWDKGVFECGLKYLGLAGPKSDKVLILDLEKGQDQQEAGGFFNLAAYAIGKLKTKKVIFFGGKQELEILRLAGISGLEDGGVKREDAKIMAYLVNGGRSEISLNKLAAGQKLKLKYWDRMLELKKGQTRLLLDRKEDQKEEEIYKRYLAERVSAVKKIYMDLRQGLEYIVGYQNKMGIFPKPAGKSDGKYDLGFVYREIELPLVSVLVDMEMEGVKIDKKELEILAIQYRRQVDKIRAKVMKIAGRKFNLDSSQQLSRVFYEKLGLSTEGIKKGKSGFYSTSAEALEVLAPMSEAVGFVLKYRELTKLMNTYIEPLGKLINKETGRLHTQFNQEITSTGRLSSSNPNLQNIPIRTEEGQRIRGAFVARSGFELVSADYSQIELRVAAHYSGDKTMLRVFRRGEDIHTETAARIHGLDDKEVTGEIRRTAKALNFGLIYGMGAFGFARSAGISVGQARDFIAKYKEKFPRMFEYVEEARQTAKEKGYVETMFGRRRYVPEIKARNWRQRASGERMAINMPLQGTAADIMKLAMARVREFIIKNKFEDQVKMILSVHDEILFEIKKGRVKKISGQLKQVMESAASLSVPLVVDLKRGRNWGKMR
ncbi:MAG: DNA polymerase I [Patescibacteria group bacterium]